MKYESQKQRMIDEAKSGSGGGKSSKRKRSKMKSKLMQLNKTKFSGGKISKPQQRKND